MFFLFSLKIHAQVSTLLRTCGEGAEVAACDAGQTCLAITPSDAEISVSACKSSISKDVGEVCNVNEGECGTNLFCLPQNYENPAVSESDPGGFLDGPESGICKTCK